MSDLCRVLLIGNLGRDFDRSVRADGVVTAVSTLWVARTVVENGYPRNERLGIEVEVIGSARVSSMLQRFGVGSRLVVEGHLEARADPDRLVVVIDQVFNADAPTPAPEARRQPQTVFWG